MAQGWAREPQLFRCFEELCPQALPMLFKAREEGQMGSELMGSLRISRFSTEGPFGYSRTVFPNMAKFITFASAPLVLLTPLSLQPKGARELGGGREGGLGRPHGRRHGAPRHRGLTDGIGTPDPDPRNLVNWCL